MLDMFPYPNITEKEPSKQISQIKTYLLQLKEALEFAFMGMSDENLANMNALTDRLNTADEQNVDTMSQVSSRMTSETDNTMSSIEQLSEKISLKVSKDEVVSSVNVSSDAIELKGNRIIIESDKFKLTKEGNIEMLEGKIKIQGSVTKKASDYTSYDAEVVNKITLGLRDATTDDLEKYDLDGDQVITVADLMIINRLLNGSMASYDVETSIEINPLEKKNILKTKGVSLGANGLYANSLRGESVYAKTIYVPKGGSSDNSFTTGMNGTFTTSDGKTVTVTKGIITSII